MSGQRPGKSLANTLAHWPFQLVELDESKPLADEMFLWGYQTAQRASGIGPESPEFVRDAANVTLAPADQIAAHLQKWAGEERLPRGESQKMLEEIFLWGYQRAAGVPSDAANFVVSAGMIFSTIRKRSVGGMSGWFLTKKDGTHESLLFGDVLSNAKKSVRLFHPNAVGLKPVIKKRPRKVRPKKAVKSVAAVPVSA